MIKDNIEYMGYEIVGIKRKLKYEKLYKKRKEKCEKFYKAIKKGKIGIISSTKHMEVE